VSQFDLDNEPRALDDWQYFSTPPVATANYRVEHADFIVEEQLGFEPSGEGEHVCLWIEKRGQNTQYVAKLIAQFVKQTVSKIKQRDVSYCGLKDRHGVTRQWFSVPVPVKTELDWAAFSTDQINVLHHTRHIRKLRTGVHQGNHFTILLKDVTDLAQCERNIKRIKSYGVPNYYGPQRFGHHGNNLALAKRMFNGESIRDRKLRGLVLSAARSYLFNQLLSERIKASAIAEPIDGDLFMLSGSQSFFSAQIDEQINSRLAQGDIALALPLATGSDKSLTQLAALDFETQCLAPFELWLQGLKAARMSDSARLAVLKPTDLAYDIKANTIRLSFSLPRGSFATALLREIAKVTDAQITDAKAVTTANRD